MTAALRLRKPVSLICIVLAGVLWQSTAMARSLTQPPSVALRTELSFVTVIDLVVIEEQADHLTAIFTPVRSLHNEEVVAQLRLTIPDSAQAMLQVGERYIAGYQKKRRMGKGEPRRYETFPDGPILLVAHGTKPALFPYHERLEQSLTADPAAAAADPAALITHIWSGLDLPTLAHKRFYLRELINWTALHDDLTDADIAALRDVFTAPWLASDMLAAFYEFRPLLQNQLGLDRLRGRANFVLAGSTVQLDPLSAQPYLLQQILRFLGSDQTPPPNTDVLTRWVYSNHHLVAEKAILLMAEESPETAIDIAHQALQSNALPVAVQRVLEQFLRNNENE